MDIGTSYWKAALYDSSGNVISSGILPSKLHAGSQFQYYDANELWEAVVWLLGKIISRVKNSRDIKGIAVTSMAESVVPVDRRGRVIFPVITWYDKCTEEQAGYLADKIGAEKICGVTGLYLKHIYSANKILWIKQNKPEVHRNAHKYLCISDYIVYKLTGSYLTDYSMASRTMLFDINRKKWSDFLLERSGIEVSKLPQLKESGYPAGTPAVNACRATGLSRKTVVSVGGHDHVCAAFAAGVVSEGGLFDSIGTVESIFTVVNKPVTGDSKCKSGFSSGCHVEKGKYYLMGGIYTAGAVVDWLAGVLGSQKKLSKGKKLEFIKNALNAPSSCMESGQDIFFLPYFRGSGPPEVDYSRKGAIYGLGLSHNGRDIMKAAVYGLNCESRKMAEAIAELTEKQITGYTVSGSLSEIGSWMQAKADFLNREIEVVNVKETGTLGAAMLGGLGAEVFSSAHDLRNRIKCSKTVYAPRKNKRAGFERYYEKYRKITRLSTRYL